MQYRDFGKTGIKLSPLGFGTMRLPTIKNVIKDIDESEAIKMIRHGIDSGINYVDTAFMYHDGNSEIVLGKALKDGYREKTYIADKLALWGCNSYEDLDKVFETQLKRLDVESIDFYLVHCLQRGFWDKKEELRLLEWCDKIRKSGKIKYLGFSFHDTIDVFKEIVDGYNWDFCQIQYNYMNEHVQAGTEGMKYASEKGLPVIIMEPLLGGMLANPTQSIQTIWDKTGFNTVETALKWLWDKPEIAVVLSGMSNMKQLEDNLKYAAGSSQINSLTDKEKEVIATSVKSFNELMKIPCTKCSYCVAECPKQIPIPEIFEGYNLLEKNSVLYPMLYSQLPEDINAGACINCKKCEKKCPQGIKISEEMPKVHEALKPADK
jgi:uncharacterized protein